jgi:pantoate--beta-alanine ligase
MIIFRERAELSAYLSALRLQQQSIGFVPTMGALHEGHLSLLQAAARQCDTVICSIFVNPTQFNDKKDFEKYPVRTPEDIEKLLTTATDILFLPSVEEVYEHGATRLPAYDFGPLEHVLEGAFRPGHFQGVGQVMHQLLDIIQPDLLFMGQKDYQQILIINKLIEILAIKTKMVPCPVVRDPDGLAMSSRNVRLSDKAREKAPAIYQTLLFVKDNLHRKSFRELTEKATHQLQQHGFEVDYVAIADGRNLQLLQKPVAGPMVCLIAAWLEGVRLIDNILLN